MDREHLQNSFRSIIAYVEYVTLYTLRVAIAH